ncbi:S41 family peptidase [Sphingomonas baiyangensis]|nr:S41 family peptidase [Sphingomonas baiyangensis]
MLAGCGGGGGGSAGGTAVVPAPTPTPTPGATTPPVTTACSVAARKDWVTARMREWYLFPETLPANPNPGGFGTVEAYLDSLTATARAQGRDRYFTYITSIAEENAFYQQGASAGFGFRLSYNEAADRVYVAESYEGTPALAAGIDRGAELVAIGTAENNLRSVGAIMASEGPGGVSAALGPSDPGVQRVIRFNEPTGTQRTVTIAKADYAIEPVSSRYGLRVIDDGGRRVGYVNLRTFISPADPALRNAFAQLRAQGINDLIVDFRYNGGGLISIADLMGDLMGRDRAASDIWSRTVFRPEKASQNSTRFFNPQPQSVAPMRVAFIGTSGTASASELVINAMRPYLGTNAALVGTNTFGKPVGQIGLDNAPCDDRLRVVALKVDNANGQGDYYQGLAPVMERTCQAPDDLSRPLGDPQEASTRAALDFLAGGQCTGIAGASASLARMAAPPQRQLLMPDRPSTAQREVPGSF